MREVASRAHVGGQALPQGDVVRSPQGCFDRDASTPEGNRPPRQKAVPEYLPSRERLESFAAALVIESNILDDASALSLVLNPALETLATIKRCHARAGISGQPLARPLPKISTGLRWASSPTCSILGTCVRRV